ncbi:hypothetical protein ACN20G_20680 [Streptomyces sp. BI20]|uniref:hypothetical protein n=1 Tax=Streptomyces sp. BI20 TaxID=3403460 RepID=UPI003C77CC4D
MTSPGPAAPGPTGAPDLGAPDLTGAQGAHGDPGRAGAPVGCARCGTQVLCERFSPVHLQIQWTEDAAAVCPRIAAAHASGTPAARVRDCADLRAAVDRAVTDGRLPVAGHA